LGNQAPPRDDPGFDQAFFDSPNDLLAGVTGPAGAFRRAEQFLCSRSDAIRHIRVWHLVLRAGHGHAHTVRFQLLFNKSVLVATFFECRAV
jgi:hypothetical protein